MGNNDDFLNEIYELIGDNNPERLHDLITDRMDEFGITAHQMSKMINISKSTFHRLLKQLESKEVANIDFYQILKISEFLDLNIQDVSRLYVSSMNPAHIGELENSRKASFLHRTFDIKGLKSIGFIDDLYDVEHIENRIKKFFGLNSVYQYSSEVGSVLFSRTKRSSHDKMREFWVRSAYFQFEKINNPNEYDPNKLKLLLPKIRPYTRNEEKGLLTVMQALYDIGVTVITQKYLSKTQVRGGTFVVNNKPCVVITDFNNSYATIWFALMHELYHVLYDFEELKSWVYHLSDDDTPDVQLIHEDSADFFACEMLFPSDKMDYIKHMIDSRQIVLEYAKKNHIHPSIIYNFYCYGEAQNGRNKYGLYSQYLGSPEKVLNQLRLNPWNRETIFEEIKEFKSVLENKLSTK